MFFCWIRCQKYKLVPFSDVAFAKMVSMAMRTAIRKLEDDNCIDPILLSLACIHPYNLRTQTLVGEKLLSVLVPFYGESREDISEVLEEIPDIFYPVLTQQEKWYRGFKKVKPKRGVLDKKAHQVLFEVLAPAFVCANIAWHWPRS